MRLEFGREGPDEENALVAALVEMHRARRQRSRDHGSTRERILSHFERRGERLRGEKLVTAELIERLFEGSVSLKPRRAQQELEIRGVAGTSAAGRIRVANRSQARASFDLVIGNAVEGERSPEVRFEPADGALGPGEACLVRVEAALAGWSSGERVTIPVECRWPTGADRLWLVVTASAAATPTP
jgi:hypothetical protein